MQPQFEASTYPAFSGISPFGAVGGVQLRLWDMPSSPSNSGWDIICTSFPFSRKWSGRDERNIRL